MQDERVATLIRQGQEAAQRGNVEQAREYLQAAVDLAPSNSTAWLWLAGVLADPAEQKYALEQVLQLDPDNVRAQQGLAHLNRQAPPAPPAQPVVQQWRDEEEERPRPPARGTSTLGPMTGQLTIEQELRAALRSEPAARPVPSDIAELPEEGAEEESRAPDFSAGSDDMPFRVAVAALGLLLGVGLLLFAFVLVAL